MNAESLRLEQQAGRKKTVYHESLLRRTGLWHLPLHQRSHGKKEIYGGRRGNGRGGEKVTMEGRKVRKGK